MSGSHSKAPGFAGGYLLRLYFSSSPPFGVGKKKSEFPDAIALLSLERWAKSNGKHILAVSGDKDWAAFAEKSEFIDIIAELGPAMALLQEHTERAHAIAQRLLVDIDAANRVEFVQEFTRRLDYAVSSHSIYAYADSGMCVDCDDAFLSFKDFEFVGDRNQYNFKVVRVGPEVIVVQLAIRLTVLAEASFLFSVHDSIDKDYVNLGSTWVEKETDFEAEVLVTFQGDFEHNNVHITGVDIVYGPSSVDFGYIEPDDWK